MSKASPVIDTRQLGLPAIPPAFGQTLVEAIAICLTERNHPPGITLTVESDFYTEICLNYCPNTPENIEIMHQAIHENLGR